MLLARTKDDDLGTQFHFVGKAFIFINNSVWRSYVSPKIDEHISYLRDFFRAPHQSLDNYVRHQHDDLANFALQHASFYADVTINRRGTTEINVPFPNANPATAPRLPIDPARTNNLTHVLAAQLFFFLKNLGHGHQHHNPATDTIVDVHEIIDDDDISWRQHTLYAMYRSVIEYKRHPHSATFNNSLGIIAYAATFHGLCEEELRSDDHIKLPKYYGENTSTSIRATQSRTERILLIKQRGQDTLRNTLLAVLSIILSFAGLVQLTNYKANSVPDSFAAKIINIVVANFTATAIAAIIAVSVVLQINKIKSDDRVGVVMATFMRIAQPFRRSTVLGVLVFLVLLFVFVFLSYW